MLNVQWHQADHLAAEYIAKPASLNGHVVSIPKIRNQSVQFLFAPEKAHSGQVPRKILVSWYRDYPPLAAGQRWQLDLKLMPPRGRVNFYGFDYERWLFGNRIGALASVRVGQRLSDNEPWSSRPVLAIRQAISRFISEQNSDSAVAGLARALTVGDRAGLDPAQWRLLATTGTSHLVAISGLHVGMVAVLGFFIGRLVFWLFPLQKPNWNAIKAGAFCAIVIAVAYSLLAGLVLPTRRALSMLVILIAALLTRRPVRPFSALSWALGAVLLLDPLAPLLAGFWLSFGAVFILTFGLSGRLSGGGKAAGFIAAQWLIIIGLLPLTVIWFQRISWAAMLANVVAIPVISLLVLPLLLLMLLLLPMAPELAAFVFSIAAYPIKALLALLSWLSQLPMVASPVSVPPPGLILLAMAGAGWLLMPRGWPGRWLGFVLLWPLFWPSQSALLAGQWRLHMLDVGQGLAVLIETREHLLLYDSGPGDGKAVNMLASTINPAILQTGQGGPDRIVISHADLDHAGGLNSLEEEYPAADWRVSLPGDEPGKELCEAGESWQWDGVEFQILHPTVGLPYIGNNSSCVLYVSSALGSILLAGDITEVIEQRLTWQQPNLQADVLLVPHHGSKTSSSAVFLETVKPRLALVSAGYLNRFGLPELSVSERYRKRGSQLLSSANCGALLVQSGPGKALSWRSARLARQGFWRQSASVECQSMVFPDRDRTGGFGYHSRPVSND